MSENEHVLVDHTGEKVIGIITGYDPVERVTSYKQLDDEGFCSLKHEKMPLNVITVKNKLAWNTYNRLLTPPVLDRDLKVSDIERQVKK